jgi:hypothetical protein
MAMLKSQSSEHEKQRMRDEIDRQVEEFLRRGGKIDIVQDKHSSSASSVGSVWHTQEETSALVPL